MTTSKMGATAKRQLQLALVLSLAAVCIHSVGCEQTPSTSGFKESASPTSDDQLVLSLNRADGLGGNSLRANSRLLAVPLSLARFMFPHSSRPGGDHQAGLMGSSGYGGSGASNNKRSSSQLDALTGVTGLGKRSVPIEYFNLEAPLFSRQNLARNSAQRNHDLRWAPVDTIETPILASSDY